MSVRRILRDAEAIKSLAISLSRCPEITKFDKGEDKEAWALAHAFSDLEESFLKFLEHHLPALTQSQMEGSDIHNLLLDIGEEFRHIIYHIKNTKFYQYIDNAQ